jgi:pimeloyl-ACP methyl ester carboxylesterase
MSIGRIKTPNNIEICYETFGAENNTSPIVLILGAGLRMLAWPDEFWELSADHGNFVIRFDNRDTGESTILNHLPTPAPLRFALMHTIGLRISSPYTLEEMAADLVHLIDSLCIQKAHLVGISLGGMIAQVAGIIWGNRAASLACIVTSARNFRYTMPKISIVLKILHTPRPGGQGYIDWSINLIRAVGGPAAEGPDGYLLEMSGRMFDRGISDDGMRRQVCAVYAAPDRRSALSKVTIPTLAIHGAVTH